MNLETIVKEAKKKRASDIHLVSGYPIVFRVFGQLKEVSTHRLKPENLLAIMDAVCTPKQRTEFEKKRDLDFGMTVDGSRIRVNAHIQREVPALSIRLVNSQIPAIDSLGLPHILKNFSERSQGLVLLSGPTGSGKQ